MKRMRINTPKVNRIVKYFVLADLALYAGWGFIAPIFSVFIIRDIVGATLVTAGVSSAIYWGARAVIQPPVAAFLDKRKGEKDDFYTLIGGLVAISGTAFMLAAIETIPQLYTVQALHGMALGIYSVSWPAIYSRHLDEGRYALDWSLDRATLAASTAVTSFVGGFVADKFGFDTAFIIAGILSFVSALFIFAVPELALPPAKKKPEEPEIGITQRQGTEQTH